MRTISANAMAAEISRARQIGWLFHFFALRDGMVTLPNGWGSWCYSSGFQGAVNFTDACDYAGDGVQSRSYTPAAIPPESDALAAIQDGGLDVRTINLMIDDTLDPFANYCDGKWPLRFGLVIYKVHRNGDAIALVDGVPVSQIRYVGFLKATKFVADTNGKKLTTEWASFHDVFSRKVPVPTFSLYCTKKLFATGKAVLNCGADKSSVLVAGTVAAVNNDLVRATAWAAKPDGWFANGLIEYSAVDPVSGLTFGFALDVLSSRKITSDYVDYGDLLVAPRPPLPILGLTVNAYGGCDRSRETCISKHRPAGGGNANPNAGEIDFVVVMPNGGAIPIVGGAITVSATAPSSPGPDVHVEINGSTYVPSDVPFTLAPPLPVAANTLSVENVAGAGVAISQQPSSGNGYTAIIGIPNTMTDFRFNVFWGSGPLGNLENFGGAPDMPVKNPAFE